jgi:site-specific DNA-methyltransferase (adenine-specific)
VFVCAALPTKGMNEEANSHGLFETHFGGSTGRVGNRYPKLQLFTLAELFQGRRPQLPPLVSANRKAARVEVRASHQPDAQGGLDL